MLNQANRYYCDANGTSIFVLSIVQWKLSSLLRLQLNTSIGIRFTHRLAIFLHGRRNERRPPAASDAQQVQALEAELLMSSMALTNELTGAVRRQYGDGACSKTDGRLTSRHMMPTWPHHVPVKGNQHESSQ